MLLPETADFHWLGVATQVTTSRECNHAWHSDVTSKNAFGVEMKHTFACTYTAKTNMIDLKM